MLTVFFGVIGFTVVILALVVVLLFAKARLVSSGDVTITINDDPDKAMKTHAGGSLLGTLAENKIFIPSACGGQGTCGVCRVVVKEGGGSLLPTETVVDLGQLQISLVEKFVIQLAIDLPQAGHHVQDISARLA